MLGYRQSFSDIPSPSLSEEQIISVLEDVLAPRHFFLAPGFQIQLKNQKEETIPWEIFHGRLLPAAQTRELRSFHSWNCFFVENGIPSDLPLLSLKWDKETNKLFIVRGLLSYVWEGYQGEGNVYLSREVRKWVSELVGTVELTDFSLESLADELAGRLFQAVVGISRLPLTSVEAPLPGFSLGFLAYFYRAKTNSNSEQVRRSAEELLLDFSTELSDQEKTKLLEFVLRCSTKNQIREIVQRFGVRWNGLGNDSKALTALLRNVVNDVSLSPYTSFVDHLLLFIEELVIQKFLSIPDQVDFYSYILRHLVRHLTAYDLFHFHNRGANYPDALFLDAVLKNYSRLIEQHPKLFLEETHRLRRRAFRQGLLARLSYSGHPVPDAPTSPGENTRVLPDPFLRVPEEQLLQTHKRKRYLFEKDPIETLLTEQIHSVWRISLEDLQHETEIQELGMATFIDRPLGAPKFPGEPDQTILFSHVAFSRSIALHRLDLLQRKAPIAVDVPWEQICESLARLTVAGIPAREYKHEARRVVSLADAATVADDFLFLQTSRTTIRSVFEQYPKTKVGNLETEKRFLILPEPGRSSPRSVKLVIFDSQYQRRLEWEVDLSQGYLCRGGREYPVTSLIE